jgi:hypothetical protein
LLRSSDAAYIQLEVDIAEMLATTDAEALAEPLKMAKRDPELVASAWEFHNTVLAIDREMSL